MRTCRAHARASDPDGLTAIDILVNPDDATVERAKAVNARLRQCVPSRCTLDATHLPHVTTLQRYVHTKHLDEVVGAVESVISATDLSALDYEAAVIRCTDWNATGQGLAVFFVTINCQVPDFQTAILVAVTPSVDSDGTGAAFVTEADEPDIEENTLRWVDAVVPDQIGPEYVPHVSLEFATLAELEVIGAETCDPFPIVPISIAACHLGNNGNARTELHSRKV